MWVQPETTQKLYVALWAAFLASCFFPFRLVGLALGKELLASGPLTRAGAGALRPRTCPPPPDPHLRPQDAPPTPDPPVALGQAAHALASLHPSPQWLSIRTFAFGRHGVHPA